MFLHNVRALQREVHSRGRHISCVLEPYVTFTQQVGPAFQLFCGRLPVAAGSLNLAGCAVACALFVEMADYSGCVAIDFSGEVCLRYGKFFPAMTVFHSILRIAKWRVTPQGSHRQSWWSAPIARTTKDTGSVSCSCHC